MRLSLILFSGAFALHTPVSFAQMQGEASDTRINFGDDESDWSKDGKCDDNRFTGKAMAGTELLETDTLHDASDCKAGFISGELTLRSETKPSAEFTPVTLDGIDFGVDDSFFANDGECDDPRFQGEGMTDVMFPDGKTRSDASDCAAAYESGLIELTSDDRTDDRNSVSSSIQNPQDETTDKDASDLTKLPSPDHQN